ncbi:DUF2155 domain-containing protein [uncultured Brevundimonas sp.]|uniref:DUF2155 domain-containing protein n=1 Tax=uncultured Brevundimonas sp. TaxID=213418 RepID=UPI0030EBCA6D|tara:strand:- start:1041 stop:1745 length:705 start_codon:yes stop_codon:yes gene_type:complete
MNHRGLILTAVVAVTLSGSGAVGARALLDVPQDATPASDPIADLLRQTPQRPETPAVKPVAAPVPTPAPTPAQTGVPAGPGAAARPPAAVVPVAEEKAEPKPEPVEEAPVVEISEVTRTEPEVPAGPRQRRRIAIIQAIDKVTADTMRFEVEVGGRPVRFNNTLIFKARACELSAGDELTDDAIAYLEISLQPRGVLPGTEPRQLFRGWMFASSPGVSGLEHPVYDAWVVGCKA